MRPEGRMNICPPRRLDYFVIQYIFSNFAFRACLNLYNLLGFFVIKSHYQKHL